MKKIDFKKKWSYFIIMAFVGFLVSSFVLGIIVIEYNPSIIPNEVAIEFNDLSISYTQACAFIIFGLIINIFWYFCKTLFNWAYKHAFDNKD